MNIVNFNIPQYTYNDYKNWSENWELINGYPFQALPSAVWKHSQTMSRCHAQIFNEINGNENCSCAVFIELDWKINELTVLRPDLLVVCNELQADFLEFPPTMIVEILSPSTNLKDRTIKFEIYQSQGVLFYILLDYIKSNVTVFELIDNKYKQTERNVFQIDANCKISLDFSKIINK